MTRRLSFPLPSTVLLRWLATLLLLLKFRTLEGMNNRIKVIKRMVYWYRDTEYFYLKIRAAFPGKVR